MHKIQIIGALLIAVALTGCMMSKKVAVCLDYHKGGHGTLKFGAGAWSGGDILEVNMNGPARYVQLPKDQKTDPCKHEPEPPAIGLVQ